MTPTAAPHTSAGMALLAGLILAGCAERGGADSLMLEDLPVLRIQEGRRLGAVDDPDLGFTRPAAAVEDAHGHLVVWEAGEGIRIYQGADLLRRLSGPGDGPGEFQGLSGLGVHGDTIWMLDGALQRITLFDHAGTVLSARRYEDVRIPLPRGFGYATPATMRADGMFTSALNRIGYGRPDDPPTGVERGDSIPVPNVLFDAEGGVVDTVGWDSRPPPRMYRAEPDPEYRSIETGSGRYGVPTPPTEHPMWHDLPDGRIEVDVPAARKAEDAIFTVRRLNLEEDTVFARVIRYEPRPYTAADLDSTAARAARRSNLFIDGAPAGAADDADQVARRLREEMDFPPYRLPIAYSLAGQDEGVWLRLNGDEGASTGRWLLIHPDGVPRGLVELPSRARPLWSEGDAFWVSLPDEMDVPWLVRYRISP